MSHISRVASVASRKQMEVRERYELDLSACCGGLWRS